MYQGWANIMFTRLKHECGGIAHLVGKQLSFGWNMFCCNRCGEAFYRWITKAMLERQPKG
jgi:hypothetical protein